MYGAIEVFVEELTEGQRERDRTNLVPFPETELDTQLYS